MQSKKPTPTVLRHFISDGPVTTLAGGITANGGQKLQGSDGQGGVMAGKFGCFRPSLAARTMEEEEQAREIARTVSADQQPLLDRMWDTPATTWAGLRAKAASAMLWAPDFLETIDGASDGGSIIVSILRDLMGDAPPPMSEPAGT